MSRPHYKLCREGPYCRFKPRCKFFHPEGWNDHISSQLKDYERRLEDNKSKMKTDNTKKNKNTKMKNKSNQKVNKVDEPEMEISVPATPQSELVHLVEYLVFRWLTGDKEVSNQTYCSSRSPLLYHYLGSTVTTLSFTSGQGVIDYERQGQGLGRYHSGAVYYGGWEGGCREGEGRLWTSSGSCLRGAWSCCKLVGEAELQVVAGLGGDQEPVQVLAKVTFTLEDWWMEGEQCQGEDYDELLLAKMEHLEARVRQGEQVDGKVLFAPAMTNMRRLVSRAKELNMEALDMVDWDKVESWRKEQEELLGGGEKLYYNVDEALQQMSVVANPSFFSGQRKLFAWREKFFQAKFKSRYFGDETSTWVTEGFHDFHRFHTVSHNICVNFDMVTRLAASKRVLEPERGERFYFPADQIRSYMARQQYSWNWEQEAEGWAVVDDTMKDAYDEESLHKKSMVRDADDQSSMSLSALVFLEDLKMPGEQSDVDDEIENYDEDEFILSTLTKDVDDILTLKEDEETKENNHKEAH